MPIKVEGLTRIKEREKIFSVLMEAFEKYPRLTVAFPDQTRRQMVIEATLRHEVAYALRYGKAYSLDASCKDVIVLMDSTQLHHTKWKEFLARCNVGKVRSIIHRLTDQENGCRTELFQEMADMQNDLSFPTHFLYVNFLAVRTAYQRQGRGRLLLEEVISYSEKTRIPLLLCTDKTDQVKFYQDLGFRAIGITSSKKYKYINTYLVREVHGGQC